MLVLNLKKSVSDLPGDKIPRALISVDQPPTLCLVSNHQILGFQTKLTFDLNSIFEKFEIKIKLENCCILKEIKNTVNGDYYRKFTQDLEDLIGDSVETPFQCTWEVLEVALAKAVGKNAKAFIVLFGLVLYGLVAGF